MARQYGLNEYRRIAKTEFGFTNFQWVLEGVVARSSQPFYHGHDKKQTIGPVEAQFLKSNNIGCIISANHCVMSNVGKKMLSNAGIQFHHYQVMDYQPPSRFQLVSAANLIEATRAAGRATLVYCGYGQGRTGSFVAGWATQKHLAPQANLNLAQVCDGAFLKKTFGVETDAQVLAVRGAAGIAPPLPPLPIIPPPLPPLPGTAPAFPPGLALPNFGGDSGNTFFQNFGSGTSSIGMPGDNNLSGFSF